MSTPSVSSSAIFELIINPCQTNDFTITTVQTLEYTIGQGLLTSDAFIPQSTPDCGYVPQYSLSLDVPYLTLDADTLQISTDDLSNEGTVSIDVIASLEFPEDYTRAMNKQLTD